MAFGLSKTMCLTNTLQAIVFLLVAVICADSFTAGQVNVQPNTALLNEGDRTELLCLYAGPINYCRINIPGEKVLNLSPEWNKTPGFTYHGAGLAAGECGVSIERVKAINNGQVECSLGVQGEEQSGAINLVVAMRPQQPVIERLAKSDREDYFSENNQFRALCIVRDGRPAANISWYIDDQPIYEGVGQLEVEPSDHVDRNMTLFTAKRQIQWQLRPEDNERKLICRSHHQTDRENVPPQESVYVLEVRFAPVRQPEILVYGLYLEQTALINVTIRANPAPIIEWTVDGDVIPQRSQNGRYEVSIPQYLGQDYYNVTMSIAGLTLEDTTKTYYLKASNALGSTDYAVRISSSSTPPSAGLEMGAIVGIVVAIAVLVLIVLLIIFARATGRWCFGGKSMKSQTNETLHTPGHGQSVALLETPNGVTIIGNKHTNEHVAAMDRNSGSATTMLRRGGSQAALDEGLDDDSFEYATDRESSVYNPTTVPIRSVMAAAGGRNSQKPVGGDGEAKPGKEASESGGDLLTRGNQLGIPESRFSRWLPKDQREILEKQAKLLAGRVHTKAKAKSDKPPPLPLPAERSTVKAAEDDATDAPLAVESRTGSATHLQETEI